MEDVLTLLRRLYDKYLPVSGRLPLEGITVGEDFQTNLRDACASQDRVSFPCHSLNQMAAMLPLLQCGEIGVSIFCSTHNTDFGINHVATKGLGLWLTSV